MCSLQFTAKLNLCRADVEGRCSFECVVCKYGSIEGKKVILEHLESFRLEEMGN